MMTSIVREPFIRACAKIAMQELLAHTLKAGALINAKQIASDAFAIADEMVTECERGQD